jgi:hypothetical protein
VEIMQMTDPERSTPAISVVLVTYQSQSCVVAAIRSAVAAVEAAGLEYELLVVDNASTDGTAETVAATFPIATVVRNSDNRGFGQANNQAFDRALGEFLLLLNPDAELEVRSVARLVGFLRHTPSAVGAAPTIMGPGRSESCGMLPSLRSMIGHYFFLNRLFPFPANSSWRGFALPRTRSPRPILVGWASAAALMLRADVTRAVGGFDESFFLYGEDIELCERLGKHGTLWLVPDAIAHHLIAASQGRVTTKWVDALDRLYARSAGRTKLAVFDLVMALGLGIRAALALSRSKDPETALHRRRMTASARRCLALAFLALRPGSRRPSA